MSNPPVSALYREVILDHFENPRFKKDLKEFDEEVEGYNPLCGDRVTLRIKISKENSVKKLKNISVKTEGCSICVASGSIMAEELNGKEIGFIKKYIDRFKEMIKGGDIISSETGDVEMLEGVKNFPARIKCALLPWTSMEEGLSKGDHNYE
ncbi:MAG: SUF system NifU family Fe-S cluster assembly protein [Nitrospinota bacterium]|nr:SUF system NifU family Fe-S cluster assembly protein [Nitrospinota bacterium]